MTQPAFDQASAWGPAWSPDGHGIAFSSDGGGAGRTDIRILELE